MNLKDMVGGALQQKFQNSFERVMENMQDENTPYKDKRQITITMILSRLVDTFFSRISLTMPLPPKFHNTAYVLLWEEDLHWQSRSSGCSSS